MRMILYILFLILMTVTTGICLIIGYCIDIPVKLYKFIKNKHIKFAKL